MIIELLLGFGIGVYVGYKYPQQVERALEFARKSVHDLKGMFGKKGGGQE